MSDGWAVAAGPAAIAVLLALAPVSELDYLLQMVRRRHGFRHADRLTGEATKPARQVVPIQVRWGCFALAAGVVLAVRRPLVS